MTPPFEFSFSGILDASLFQTEPLDFPFSQFALPLTAEIQYSLSPSDFRTNDGGFGGFGVSVSSEEKNIGFELQASNPSSIFVYTYTDYEPADPDIYGPDAVLVTRQDYMGTWALGTPVIRVTIDVDLVPHLYLDGIEVVLTPDGGPQLEYPLENGNYANAYAYAGAPAHVVTVGSLEIVGSLVPPPAPL